MSMFSGKCDLYDCIYALFSYKAEKDSEDAMFEKFRRKTGGVIYIPVRVQLSDRNEGKLLSMSSPYAFSKALDGKRHHYLCCGKLFRSQKSINRAGGIVLERPVHFSTRMELVPYYGYLIAQAVSSGGHTHIVLSEYSYPLLEDIDCFYNGIDYDFHRSDRYSSMIAKEESEIMKENRNGK